MTLNQFKLKLVGLILFVSAFSFSCSDMEQVAPIAADAEELLLTPESFQITENGLDEVSEVNARTLSTPLLVVTVRAQGSNRFGNVYWTGATPSVRTDVFRNGSRIATVNGSTTGNNLFVDSVRGLRGTFKYQVCYSGTNVCSNSITVVYDSSTQTIRYAPECPTTGSAICIVTLE